MSTDIVSARSGHDRAAQRSYVKMMARIGYFAKGIVYATVGLLSASAVFGWFGGGDVSGTRGAVEAIAAQPFGNFLLIVLIAGLTGYVVWRFTQGLADTENKGSDASGWIQRIGFMISGSMYAVLAFYAATLTGWFSSPSSGQGASTKKELTAELMSHQWGIWLVGIVGLCFLLVGVYQAYRAYSKKFKEKWKTQHLSKSEERLATRFAQFGIGVRAVTFFIIGTLIMKAAMNANPSQAEGLGQALRTLYQQPYGPYLLGTAAVGLICYGAYCLVNARYRIMAID